jgi:hypothetical protein
MEVLVFRGTGVAVVDTPKGLLMGPVEGMREVVRRMMEERKRAEKAKKQRR